MLCRNVNAKTGLVNGATGVLKKINYVEQKAVELIIKFDRIDELQTINRVNALYDVSLDQQCCRSQFPVKMSFAATIHKCQGLTLKNVLVSMENSFAAGQIFVACSRVQHISGLHLLDLVLDKIKVDIPSMQQYNKHREIIGLPAYNICDKTTKLKTEDKTKKRQLNDTKSKI